jgi:hypothetical protein
MSIRRSKKFRTMRLRILWPDSFSGGLRLDCWMSCPREVSRASELLPRAPCAWLDAGFREEPGALLVVLDQLEADAFTIFDCG